MEDYHCIFYDGTSSSELNKQVKIINLIIMELNIFQ